MSEGAKRPRPPRAYELPPAEARALFRSNGGRSDPGCDAFVAVLQLEAHLEACAQQAGLGPVFLTELRRTARIMERRLQRQLLARDHGGSIPWSHPALAEQAERFRLVNGRK